MPRQTLTKQTALGGYPNLPLTATSANVTMTAANTTDKEQFVATGRELVIAHNTGASARTVTFTSTTDTRNRTGDITAYSIGAGLIAVFGPFPLEGWRQTDGMVYMEANHAEVKFGVIVLP